MPDKQKPKINEKVKDLMATTYGANTDQQARINKYLREQQTHTDYNNRWAAMMAATS